ncbi:MAG TPA: SRPBCC family protein [Methylophilaceae bacterium]|jgi:uncharacterized protein YndB with AHSA1/START domain
MSTNSETDRIERSIVINAPRERVWFALSNAEDFGKWFGVNLASQTFAQGARTRGMKANSCGGNAWFDVRVERIEPQDLFSFHWHPYSGDTAVDNPGEQTTLVTFTLKDAPGNGTLLSVVESGFDNLPPSRRMEAFPMHSKGWDGQMENIVRHLSA